MLAMKNAMPCVWLCLARYNLSVQIENANRAYQNAKVAMYAKETQPKTIPR
jgi:hypothetical protein